MAMMIACANNIFNDTQKHSHSNPMSGVWKHYCCDDSSIIPIILIVLANRCEFHNIYATFNLFGQQTVCLHSIKYAVINTEIICNIECQRAKFIWFIYLNVIQTHKTHTHTQKECACFFFLIRDKQNEKIHNLSKRKEWIQGIQFGWYYMEWTPKQIKCELECV